MALINGALLTKPTVLRQANSAWKLLNGVICIYKDQGMSMTKVYKILQNKLCQDLNSMERLPRQDIVKIVRVPINESIARPSSNLPKTPSSSLESNSDLNAELIGEIQDGKGVIRVLKQKSLADHPLLVGPGYNLDDIKIRTANKLQRESSGLIVLGINDKGDFQASLIKKNMWLKTYILSGQLGKATDTFFHTGRVLEKARFEKIEKVFIDRILAKTQASHQRLAFDAAGVRMDSERAYELASQGPVRPVDTSSPIVYSVKCLKLDLPHFDLEISTVNETENYLCQFIHELGLKLHTVAVCTKIRCSTYGPFSTETALLSKHWTLEHVLENMNHTSTILKKLNLFEREPMVHNF